MSQASPTNLRVLKTFTTLASRPLVPEAERIDGIQARFRAAYAADECCFLYQHVRPVPLRGYGFGLHGYYQKGDPRAWRLEARIEGAWKTLHKVSDDWHWLDDSSFSARRAISLLVILCLQVHDFVFQGRDDWFCAYLPDTEAVISDTYRLVIDRFYGYSPHMVLEEFALLVRTDLLPPGKEDWVPMCHSEAATVYINLRSREGQARLQTYCLDSGPGGPSSWVLEGFAEIE